MPPFPYYPTPSFAARMTKIEKHHPPGHFGILTVIDRLLANPVDANGGMHGHYQGRLKMYAGRREYCLIYNWCVLCRKDAKKLEDMCGFCL